MPVEYWNPVPIYYADLPPNEFHTIRREVLTKLKPEMFNKTTWHDLVGTTLKVSENIVDYLELNLLKNIITNHTLHFIKSISDQQSIKLSLFNSWFNKCDKYGFQNTHVHTSYRKGISNNLNVISGVYYYDYYDENFKCPLVFKLYNNLGMDDVYYGYVPGRIIIFHGTTPHCVNYNQSEKPRTSFTFNFLCGE